MGRLKEAVVGGPPESKTDWALHFFSVIPKIACAFIPNADLLGGYPCFVLSITMVGLITFFVQASLTQTQTLALTQTQTLALTQTQTLALTLTLTQAHSPQPTTHNPNANPNASPNANPNANPTPTPNQESARSV